LYQIFLLQHMLQPSHQQLLLLLVVCFVLPVASSNSFPLNLYALLYPPFVGLLALWLCSTIIYLTNVILFWCSVNLAKLRFHQTAVFRSNGLVFQSCLLNTYYFLNGRYGISHWYYFSLVFDESSISPNW